MNNYCCPEKIYKYIPLNGLKKTLENQSFKLSRPSDFNDPIDMYLQDTMGVDIEPFLENLKNVFHEYVETGIANAPALNPAYKKMLEFIHHTISAIPDSKKDNFRKEFLSTPIEDLYDVKKIQKTNEEVVAFINNSFRHDGVFCSTIDSNNLLMWAHYADHHKGAVIEFSPNISKDSVFLASKPVKYSDERPLLYRNANDMIKFGLSKNPEDAITEIVNNLVFTKSSEWGYEQEYRLFVPFLINDNQSFATLKFHPEEITAIFLGCRMEEKDKSDVYNLAKSINPNVIIYSSLVSPRKFEIEYVEWL